jgi:hypothetical protein
MPKIRNLDKEYGKRCEVVGNNMGMHGNYVRTIFKKPFGKNIFSPPFVFHLFLVVVLSWNNVCNVYYDSKR